MRNDLKITGKSQVILLQHLSFIIFEVILLFMLLHKCILFWFYIIYHILQLSTFMKYVSIEKITIMLLSWPYNSSLAHGEANISYLINKLTTTRLIKCDIYHIKSIFNVLGCVTELQYTLVQHILLRQKSQKYLEIRRLCSKKIPCGRLWRLGIDYNFMRSRKYLIIIITSQTHYLINKKK